MADCRRLDLAALPTEAHQQSLSHQSDELTHGQCDHILGSNRQFQNQYQ